MHHPIQLFKLVTVRMGSAAKTSCKYISALEQE